jgi:hypothetical protein
MNHFLLHVGDLFHPFAPAFVDREAVLAEDTPARDPDQPVLHSPDSLALCSLTSEAEDASPGMRLEIFSLLQYAGTSHTQRDSNWPAGRWM